MQGAHDVGCGMYNTNGCECCWCVRRSRSMPRWVMGDGCWVLGERRGSEVRRDSSLLALVVACRKTRLFLSAVVTARPAGQVLRSL
jgi:hypothetical protein